MNEKIKRLEQALAECGVAYVTVGGSDPYIEIGDDVTIDLTDGGYEMYWHGARGRFDEEATARLAESVSDLLAGKLLSYGIFVGEDCEVAGFCEEEFLDEIASDFRHDPMTLGGELAAFRYGVGECFRRVLGETE